ncbi:unnamed protein product [Protopolystoma xenopodis]|uniref:EGF-like calcium-binding domain-containing protein n=1 Tax=Protopolystoma xenopodis TaxID=117903 RepID=A0A448WSW4_9PLAT|nr:unnamed protein product [Protopolystoma xenopodis]
MIPRIQCSSRRMSVLCTKRIILYKFHPLAPPPHLLLNLLLPFPLPILLPHPLPLSFPINRSLCIPFPLAPPIYLLLTLLLPSPLPINFPRPPLLLLSRLLLLLLPLPLPLSLLIHLFFLFILPLLPTSYASYSLLLASMATLPSSFSISHFPFPICSLPPSLPLCRNQCTLNPTFTRLFPSFLPARPDKPTPPTVPPLPHLHRLADIDECAEFVEPPACSRGFVCVNTIGSYLCACQTDGYLSLLGLELVEPTPPAASTSTSTSMRQEYQQQQQQQQQEHEKKGGSAKGLHSFSPALLPGEAGHLPAAFCKGRLTEPAHLLVQAIARAESVFPFHFMPACFSKGGAALAKTGCQVGRSGVRTRHFGRGGWLKSLGHVSSGHVILWRG